MSFLDIVKVVAHIHTFSQLEMSAQESVTRSARNINVLETLPFTFEEALFNALLFNASIRIRSQT